MSYAETKAAARRESTSYRWRALTTHRSKQAGGGFADSLADSLGGGGIGGATRNREAYGMFKLWVYAAVNAIAKKLAAQPIMAGEQMNATDNPDRSRYSQHKLRESRAFLPAAARKAVDVSELEVLEDHAILDHLARPNPVQRQFEFLYMSVANLLITGECYWLGGEMDGGEWETWAVPTPWVTPRHRDGLFSSYDIQLGQQVKRGVDPSLVARTYIPDPSDPKAAFSPLRAILAPVRVDSAIVQSQENMFERGINPNLILTIAQERGPDGKPTGRRPKLQGHQRRSLVRAVRSVWNEAVAAGEPAIIDGLVESVHKLHNTPREMDWTASAPGIKERIMQTYGVNPINLGQIEGANRASAVEAQKTLCENAVNPIGMSLSETLTDFFGPKVEEPQRLILWIEPCEPKDPELELQRWTAARNNDDVTRDEFRANVLGIGPDERPARGPMLGLVGGFTGTATILGQVGQGLMSREAAVAIFETFFQIDTTTAERMVGEVVVLPPAESTVPALPEPEGKPPEESIERVAAAVSGCVQGSVDGLTTKVDGLRDELHGAMSKALADLAEPKPNG